MSGRAALAVAIRSDPDEDTPRRALADWYEENGDAARAEFIRVQCDLARLDPRDDRYSELHVRQLELLAEHERDWLGEWAERLVRWEFRRGMLEDIAVCPEPYCRHGAELFRDHPVWRVAFVDELGESLAPPAIRDVVRQPHSTHLRAIDAAACRADEQAAAMFGSEIHTNAWLAELARATAISDLKELSLYGGTRGGRQNIDLADWQAFCAAGHLRSLTHLDLSNLYDYRGSSAAWESHLRELAAATFAPRLQSLRLDGCYAGPEALLHLTRSGRFHQLQTLVVGGGSSAGSPAGVLPELLDPQVLPALRDLTTPYGRHLVALADHPGWERITRLGFHGNDDHMNRETATHAAIWRAVFRSPRIRPAAFTAGSTGYYDPAAAGFWDELAGTA